MLRLGFTSLIHVSAADEKLKVSKGLADIPKRRELRGASADAELSALDLMSG